MKWGTRSGDVSATIPFFFASYDAAVSTRERFISTVLGQLAVVYMNFRRLGKTGLKVSEIGLGTEYLRRASKETVASVVDTAIESGVNYIDLLFNFHECLDNFGAALKGRRDEIILTHHLGSAGKHGQYRKTRKVTKCEKIFEDALSILGTDYIDIAHVHYVKNAKEYEEVTAPGSVLDLARRLKREGKAHLVGISTHEASVVSKAAKSGKFDVVMFQVNMANNALPGRNAALATCAHEGISLIAMKPFAGGYLLRRSKTVTITAIRKGGGKSIKVAIPSTISPVHCISYVLSQVGVSTAIPGVRSVEELEEVLSYLEATDKEKDFSEFIKDFKEYKTGQCVYCNHCLPCPSQIDIGEVTRLLDIATHGLTEAIKAKYNSLPITASACTECGACIDRCPFEVDIIPNMKKATKLFG